VLSETERPGAELLAWSAVHGLAMLALEGPLRDLPPGAVDELAPRLVRMVDLGLGLGGGAPAAAPDSPPAAAPDSRPAAPALSDSPHADGPADHRA